MSSILSGWPIFVSLCQIKLSLLYDYLEIIFNFSGFLGKQ